MKMYPSSNPTTVRPMTTGAQLVLAISCTRDFLPLLVR